MFVGNKKDIDSSDLYLIMCFIKVTVKVRRKIR